MRHAPSITIIHNLLKEGAQVTAYDPKATTNAKKIFKNKIRYAASAIVCLQNADAAILVTEWDEFKKLTPADFVKYMKQPILFDGRRIYNHISYSENLKFKAVGLG